MKTDENISVDMNIDIHINGLHVRVVNLVYMAPNSRWFVPDHCHADFEFHIIPHGQGSVNIDGVDLSVGSGSFYITGPYVQHRQRADKNCPMAEFCLECEIEADKGEPGASSLTDRENLAMREILARPHACVFNGGANLTGTFLKLFHEAEETPANHYLRMQILILDLLVAMFRIVLNDSQIRYANARHAWSADEARASRLVKFIENNYRRGITLGDASKVLFLSPRQINRLMKKKYNLTFHDYLSNHRLATARHLLENSNLSIDEIAGEAGFSSVIYMYQVFRSQGLATPAQIRNESQ